MARYYRMVVEVREHHAEREEAIRKACEGLWAFEWTLVGGALCGDGEGCLVGGESEKEFAQRLARAVWRANGGFCEVMVEATYLEDLPCETYVFGEEEYEAIVGAGGE